MTNPEYWHEKGSFPMIFFGLWTIVYLWRRSMIVIWLGDGRGRVARLLL